MGPLFNALQIKYYISVTPLNQHPEALACDTHGAGRQHCTSDYVTTYEIFINVWLLKHTCLIIQDDQRQL